MPTVPTYGQPGDAVYGAPKESIAPLPGVRTTPEAQGAGVGQALEQLGATAAKGSLTLADQIVKDANEQADQVALLSAQRKLGDLEYSVLNDPQQGVYTVKGKDALGVHQTASTAFDTGASAIADDLTSDRQRIAFERARLERRDSLLRTVDGYARTEYQEYVSGEAKAGVETAANLAIANADDQQRIAEELARIQGIVRTQGPALGLRGPEAADNYLADVTTKVHEGVINQLLAEGKDRDAQSYFNMVQGKYSSARADGSTKGAGYFGPLLRPDGNATSELSIGVEIDGKETEIPTFVPTLTKDEVQTLLTIKDGQPIPDSIVQKAVDYARERMAAGKSPFAQPGEQNVGLYPEVPRVRPMTGPILARVEERLQQASTDAEALRQADTLWAKFLPASDTDPINIDQMEAAARASLSNDPKLLKETIAELRQRTQAAEAGRKQRDDGRLDSIMTAVFQGASFRQVSTLPAFLQSSGVVKEKIRDMFTRDAERAAAQANAAESRAYTRELRKERELTRTSWSTYATLQDPTVLRTLSRGDIMGHVVDGTLSQENAQRLLDDHERLMRNDAELKEAKIDNDLFLATAQNAGLTYADHPTTDDQRANVGQLRATVNDAIAEQVKVKNRKLTREEQSAVMQSVIDQKVMQRGWLWDSQVLGGATGGAKARSSLYVPLTSVDPSSRELADALQYLRGVTGNTRATDDALKKTYKSRIEHAIGLSRSGGTRLEIEGALKGLN